MPGRFAVYGSLLLATAALSLLDIRDFDYWWHLKTGELILATGRVPMVDAYTYTVPGARYIDVHWLFQVIVQLAYRLGGHAAVVIGVFATFLAAVAFAGAAGQRPDRPALAASFLTLGLLAASDRIMPRPEIATVLLLAVEAFVLERWFAKGGRSIWLLVPLHLLWANLHGLFAVGLGVIGIALAGELVDAVLFRRSLDRGRVAKLAAVLALSTAACAVNPNGFDLLLYPLQQLQMIGTPAMRRAQGMQSPELFPLIQWRRVRPPALIGFLALAALAGVAWLVEGPGRKARHALLGATFVALGVVSQRNTALFLSVGPLIAIRGWSAYLDRHPVSRSVRRGAATAVTAALLLLCADIWTGRFHLRITDARGPGLSLMDPLYPIGAASWIASHRPPGPLFHWGGDGSFLIWRLYPDYKVMLDGRLEVFGAEGLRDLSVRGTADFRRLDARYGFGLALLAYGAWDYTELMRDLARDPGWRLVYVDEVSVLFARVPSGGAPWPALDPADANLFPPLPEERSPRDLMLRLHRARFYQILGPPQRAAARLQELDLRYPGLTRTGSGG
jgi:hypothetical protein